MKIQVLGWEMLKKLWSQYSFRKPDFILTNSSSPASTIKTIDHFYIVTIFMVTMQVGS